MKREVQFEEFGMPSSHRYTYCSHRYTLLIRGTISDKEFSASSCGLLAPTWLCSQCSVYITRCVLNVCTSKNRINTFLFVFMQPACLEVLWKLAWVSYKMLHLSPVSLICTGWCMFCWCRAYGLLQGVLAISHHKPGPVPQNVVLYFIL